MRNLRAIFFLFAANIVSGVAQGISLIAIPWYFGKEEQLQSFVVLYLIVNIIALFWVPYSGTLVDRMDRKKLFLFIITVSGLLVLGIASYGQWIGDLGLWAVGSVFAITFLNFNIHYPTLYAFLQEISEKKHYGRISSILEVQGQSATIVAGALAALLLEGVQGGHLELLGMRMSVPWSVQAWRIEDIFLLDGVTYIVAFVLVLVMRYIPMTQRSKELGGVLQRLRVGLHYLRSHPVITVFGVGSHSVFVIVLIVLFYSYAVYVKDFLGEGGSVYASVDVFYGLGALLAGFGIRRLFYSVKIIDAVLILTTVMAITLGLLSQLASVTLFFVLIFLQGICNSGIRVLRVSYLFKYVPNQVYGRAASVFLVTNIIWRIVFLSVFSLSFFQGSTGVSRTLVVMCGFLVLTVLFLLRYYDRYHKDLVREI